MLRGEAGTCVHSLPWPYLPPSLTSRLVPPTPPPPPPTPAPPRLWGRRRIHARRAEAARLAAAQGALAASHPAAAAGGVVGWHHYGSTWHGGSGAKSAARRMAASGREAAHFFGDANAFLEYECAAREPVGLVARRMDLEAQQGVQEQQGQQAKGEQQGDHQETEPKEQSEEQSKVAAPGPPSSEASKELEAPPSAPAPSWSNEPGAFVCEELVIDSIASGECVALVVTGGVAADDRRHHHHDETSDSGNIGSSSSGDDARSGSDDAGGGEGGAPTAAMRRVQKTAGGSSAPGSAQPVKAFDPALAWRLRERGCIVVHVGEGTEAPAELRLGPGAVETGVVGGRGRGRERHHRRSRELQQQQQQQRGRQEQQAQAQQPQQQQEAQQQQGDHQQQPEAQRQQQQQQKQQQQPQRPLGELLHIQAVLSPFSTPLSHPPALTLGELLREADALVAPKIGLAPDLAHGEGADPWAVQQVRYALLQLACGACAWDALSELAASDARGGAEGVFGGVGAEARSSSRALAGVDSVVVEATTRPPSDYRSAQIYGLMYQRYGFLGYGHQALGPWGLRLAWAREPRERAAVREAVTGDYAIS